MHTLHTTHTTEKVTSPSRGGGPQTPEGKAQTRRNAVTHGLTATKLLAQILGTETLKRHLHRLTAEFHPATPTQELLVRELARHAAMLEVAEQAEAAVLRSGATTAANLLSSSAADGESAEALDVLLTGAVASDAVDRLTRYRRHHEKAWHLAYRQIMDLRVVPREPMSPLPVPPAPPFLFTESNCETYLKERLQAPDRRCPACHHAGGYWIAARCRWECSTCGRQVGVRSGTVMARSPLALADWFIAIWALLNDNDVPVDELMTLTKITRRATVQRIGERIRSALHAPDASLLLAGLDQFHPGKRSRPT